MGFIRRFATGFGREASQGFLSSRLHNSGVKILVVDDERAVRDSLRRALELQGYEVELASDGAEALARLAENGQTDAVVLEILMPGIDGLDVCRQLRRRGNSVPVLMITARDAVGDRVEGLDAGADDYVVKPFALEELLARVRALLRRSSPSTDGVLRFADVELDTGTREVRRGGDAIDLTRTEFNLLELFMVNPRQVLTRSRSSSRRLSSTSSSETSCATRSTAPSKRGPSRSSMRRLNGCSRTSLTQSSEGSAATSRW